MASYGGIPGSDAMISLLKEYRQKHGKPGGIIHVIYLAAFMLVIGQSLLDGRGTSDDGDFVDFDSGPGHCR